MSPSVQGHAAAAVPSHRLETLASKGHSPEQPPQASAQLGSGGHSACCVKPTELDILVCGDICL
eukprot:2407639-Amphidinium_carterae.1